MYLILALLALTIILAVYDQIHAQIPNWVTWPLILVGLWAHFPGTPSTIFSSIFLIAAAFLSDGNGLGFGDAKLWLALLWMLPPKSAVPVPTIFFVVMVATAGLQIIFRPLILHLSPYGRAEETRPSITARPAAWRAAMFMVVIVVIQILPILHG